MRKFVISLTSVALVLAVAAVPAAAKGKPDKGKTIVETVVAISGPSGFDSNAGDFDILRDAVVATGLDAKLAGKRQLTVFAPPDQAFLNLTGTSTEQEAFINYLMIKEGAIVFSTNLVVKKKLDESNEDILSLATQELRQQHSSNNKIIYTNVPILVSGDDIESATTRVPCPASTPKSVERTLAMTALPPGGRVSGATRGAANRSSE